MFGFDWFQPRKPLPDGPPSSRWLCPTPFGDRTPPHVYKIVMKWLGPGHSPRGTERSSIFYGAHGAAHAEMEDLFRALGGRDH